MQGFPKSGPLPAVLGSPNHCSEMQVLRPYLKPPPLGIGAETGSPFSLVPPVSPLHLSARFQLMPSEACFPTSTVLAQTCLQRVETLCEGNVGGVGTSALGKSVRDSIQSPSPLGDWLEKGFKIYPTAF